MLEEPMETNHKEGAHEHLVSEDSGGSAGHRH
jgi:hypothetical protein